MELCPPLLGHSVQGVSQHLGLPTFFSSSRAHPKDSSTPATSITTEIEMTHQLIAQFRPFSEFPSYICNGTSTCPQQSWSVCWCPIVVKGIPISLAARSPGTHPSQLSSLRWLLFHHHLLSLSPPKSLSDLIFFSMSLPQQSKLPQ